MSTATIFLLLLFGVGSALAQPPPVQIVSPIDSALGIEAPLNLVWTSSPGALAYTVQLATDLQFTSVGQSLTDTTLRVTQLGDFTKYFWRVRAEDLHGASAWTVATFVTKLSNPPILLTPVNKAVNVPLTASLSWRGKGARYLIQVSRLLDFSIIDVVIDTAITAIVLDSLNRDTKYYWRVKAYNSLDTTAFSGVSNFTTIPFPTNLVFPLDASTSTPVNVRFQWSRALSATSYRVQVSRSPIFSTMVLEMDVVDTTSLANPPLDYSTQYFWRVGYPYGGGTSDFSETWTFVTVAPPPLPPVLLAPLDSWLETTTSMVCSWRSSPRATRYRLQVASDQAFTRIAYADTAQSDTTAMVIGLQLVKTYFWRVSACNSEGQWSEYSATRSVGTSHQSPTQPVIVAATGAHLIWHVCHPVVTQYSVQIDESRDFSSTRLFEYTSITDTQVIDFYGAWPSLGGNMWGRVRAGNPLGWGEWSVPSYMGSSSVGDSDPFPDRPILHGNYPNPFNPSTTIKYELPKSTMVRLSVYDMLGSEGSVLVNERRDAGVYEVKFDASKLASGIYLYRLQAGDFLQSRKLLVLR